MLHENKLTLREPDDIDDILDEIGSWWRDLAVGSAFAAVAVATVMLFI